MFTRCKFICSKVTKIHDSYRKRFTYEAEFSAVYDNSEENKKFFECTPSGNLKLGVYKEDLFQPGNEYFLDISEVEKGGNLNE